MAYSFLRTNAIIPGEPSMLAHMFIVEAAQAGSHHAATAKIAESLARITAIDHRQASDMMAQHLSRSFGNQFVGMSDDQLRATRFLNSHGSESISVESTEQIAPRNDSGKSSGVVEDQQSFMAGDSGVVLRDAIGKADHFRSGRNCRQILFHGVSDTGLGENVSFVILMDA